jgi:hypothetical protein
MFSSNGLEYGVLGRYTKSERGIVVELIIVGLNGELRPLRLSGRNSFVRMVEWSEGLMRRVEL